MQDKTRYNALLDSQYSTFSNFDTFLKIVDNQD